MSAATGNGVPRRGQRRRGRGAASSRWCRGAEFTSYYGKPVLEPAGLGGARHPRLPFLGGLAGGSSLLAAGADLTGRPALEPRRQGRRLRRAISLSLAALVHDLGRPARFLNMMRVFKLDLADERRLVAARRLRARRGGGRGVPR